MNQNITIAETLFQSAIITITNPTTDQLQNFAITLQEICNNLGTIFLFRTLHYTRIRLCAKFENQQQSILKLVIGYIDTELELLARYGNRNISPETRFRWTGNLVELVEIIYALDELRCINNGEVSINELFTFFGRLFGMDMKESHCYNAYTDMKRRKSDSRTYFLDKMRERLNLRMQRDDEKERERRK